MGTRLRWVVVLVVAAAAVPAVGGLAVSHLIQRRLDLKVEGIFVPIPFFPAFYLRDARFHWKDRVELLSGDLKVDYDPASFVAGRILRVRLSGNHLEIRLLGRWAELEDTEHAQVDQFHAGLGFGPQGLEEIDSVRLQSPTFQFQIRKTET